MKKWNRRFDRRIGRVIMEPQVVRNARRRVI